MSLDLAIQSYLRARREFVSKFHLPTPMKTLIELLTLLLGLERSLKLFHECLKLYLLKCAICYLLT